MGPAAPADVSLGVNIGEPFFPWEIVFAAYERLLTSINAYYRLLTLFITPINVY